MVLIIAACLLGLISNTTLSNNSTQTHDLFRLYMIRSKQLFWIIDSLFIIWMTEVWLNNKSKYEQR